MKLTLTTFVTLDGVMQAPGGPNEDTSNEFPHGGWLVPFADEDMNTIVGEQFATADAFLLGRCTYDVFKSFWPNVTDPNDPVASKLREKPKYVVSNTSTQSDWEGTHFFPGDDALNQIKALKALSGNDLQVHGSWQLAQLLIANYLVDEYRLWIYPVVLGEGKRLFDSGTMPTSFSLADSRTTSTGVTVQTYRPTGKAKFGTFVIEDGVEAKL